MEVVGVTSIGKMLSAGGLKDEDRTWTRLGVPRLGVFSLGGFLSKTPKACAHGLKLSL